MKKINVLVLLVSLLVGSVMAQIVGNQIGPDYAYITNGVSTNSVKMVKLSRTNAVAKTHFHVEGDTNANHFSYSSLKTNEVSLVKTNAVSK
jgi:hypothetical protein